MEWPDHVDQALAVLTTLREPDADMAAAGSVQHWEAMIAAAIGKPFDHPAEIEIAKPSDGQDFALSDEDKLEESLIDSMDGSDPPAITQPGDHGDPVPSSGFVETSTHDTGQESLGHRCSSGSGPVYGSGADAGGTATSDEVYATDAVGGGGTLPQDHASEKRKSPGSATDIIVPPRSGAF
jgi:hypothetical protein